VVSQHVIHTHPISDSRPGRTPAWKESDCSGQNFAFSLFDDVDVGFARNVSNLFAARSFKLSRPLQCQEQLDISATLEPDTWFPNKDQYSLKQIVMRPFPPKL
jgi:hypothetical protein